MGTTGTRMGTTGTHMDARMNTPGTRMGLSEHWRGDPNRVL